MKMDGEITLPCNNQQLERWHNKLLLPPSHPHTHAAHTHTTPQTPTSNVKSSWRYYYDMDDRKS